MKKWFVQRISAGKNRQSLGDCPAERICAGVAAQTLIKVNYIYYSLIKKKRSQYIKQKLGQSIDKWKFVKSVDSNQASITLS